MPTPSEIREKVEESLRHYAKSTHTSAWPDDWVCGQQWGYHFHCGKAGWVPAWNAEGRITPAPDFIRAWMTDEHLEIVIAESADWQRQTEEEHAH